MNEFVPFKRDNWAYTLFVKHANLFLPVLESLKPHSAEDVKGLDIIFNELEVAPDARILDLSCGIGRHSINLAKRGYQVVGYDPSYLYIEKAKQWANEQSTEIKHRLSFLQGDAYRAAEVLSEKGETGFNAIIVMFNSFGYLGEEEDFQMLKDLLQLAAPGCILVTETDNRDWYIRHFEPYVYYEFVNLEIHEKWKLDLNTSVAESRSKFYEKDGNNHSLRLVLDLRTTIRLYSLHELRKMLNASGWNYLRSYGSIKTLESCGYECKDIVAVSQRLF